MVRGFEDPRLQARDYRRARAHARARRGAIRMLFRTLRTPSTWRTAFSASHFSNIEMTSPVSLTQPLRTIACTHHCRAHAIELLMEPARVSALGIRRIRSAGESVGMRTTGEHSSVPG